MRPCRADGQKDKASTAPATTLPLPLLDLP
jgi:hypothetical protein